MGAILREGGGGDFAQKLRCHIFKGGGVFLCCLSSKAHPCVKISALTKALKRKCLLKRSLHTFTIARPWELALVRKALKKRSAGKGTT